MFTYKRYFFIMFLVFFISFFISISLNYSILFKFLIFLLIYGFLYTILLFTPMKLSEKLLVFNGYVNWIKRGGKI